MLKDLMTKHNIRHFTADEVLKKCSKIPPPEYEENIIPTLLVADAMRDDLGFPIAINSAYRDPIHNKEIGGKPHSLHLIFNALDLRPSDNDPEKLEEMKNWLRKDFYIPYESINIINNWMGIGFHYKTFVHIDTRGLMGRKAPARW